MKTVWPVERATRLSQTALHMEPPGSPGPPDEAHIALLQEMGFSEERCREALRLSSNQARAQSLGCCCSPMRWVHLRRAHR